MIKKWVIQNTLKYRINIPKKIAEDSKLLDKEVIVRLDKEKIIIEKES
ncbi:hypothetical protein HZA33_02845 [Candidatus Pacearchaeota archaeon]|nr:hypothetical protein [Candidatus Pacearchaeota archaeon]